MANHSDTYRSHLNKQTEMLVWQDVRRGGERLSGIPFDFLESQYSRVILDFIYNVRCSQGAPNPGDESVVDALYESVMVRMRQRSRAGDFVRTEAEVDGAEHSFGYYLFRVAGEVLDTHEKTTEPPGWRACWETSSRRTPFGVGSYLIYEDVLCDIEVHYFTREYLFLQSNGLIRAESAESSDRIAESFGGNQIYAAATASRNIIRNLMEKKYAYPKGVLLMDAIGDLPMYQQERVILHILFGLDDATILLLCPADRSQDGTAEGAVVLRILEHDVKSVTERESWLPMKLSLLKRAGDKQ